MFDVYNSTGYDLYQPFDNTDQWIVVSNSSRAYAGTLKEIVIYIIEKFDFRMDDIEDGLNLIADNIWQDHDAVHFGCYKTAIFSFNYEEKHGKRAG